MISPAQLSATKRLGAAGARTHAAPSTGLRASCASLDELASDWQRLEQDGLATPYQSFGWVRSYATHALTPAEGRLACVRLADGAGRTVAILPLVVKRRAGVATAQFLGAKHANFHMGVFDRQFAAHLDAPTARSLMRQVAQAIGSVDAFIFQTQPVRWDGMANPLAALDAQSSPSPAYCLPLQADAEAALAAGMSTHARKKHRNKRARFAEMGASRLVIAEDAEQSGRILDAFLRQKRLRFAQMGIANPFDAPGVQDFLTAAALDQPNGSPLRLAGLELNGRLIATYVGACHGHRLSGMAISFEPDPAVAKISPGEILLVDLIRWACAEGYRVFDLGVGEARYKTTLCSETEDLVDGFIAITLRGRLAADVLRLERRAKGWIKHHPAMLALARRLLRRRPSGGEG